MGANFYFVSHLLRGQKNCTLFLDTVPVSRGQKREIRFLLSRNLCDIFIFLILTLSTFLFVQRTSFYLPNKTNRPNTVPVLFLFLPPSDWGSIFPAYPAPAQSYRTLFVWYHCSLPTVETSPELESSAKLSPTV